jgi:hypothetical protein
MKKSYIQHSKKCFACGIERHKKDLGYDISTLKTYCRYSEQCPNAHQIPDVDLVELSTESLQQAIKEHYEGSAAESLIAMLGKTTGARLSPALVMHLLKFAEAEDFYSINATILHILEEHMVNNEITDDLEGSNFTHKQEPKAKTVEYEVHETLPQHMEKPIGETVLIEASKRLAEAMDEKVRIIINGEAVIPAPAEKEPEVIEEVEDNVPDHAPDLKEQYREQVIEEQEEEDDDSFSF